MIELGQTILSHLRHKMLNNIGEDCWYIHLKGEFCNLSIDSLLEEIVLEQKTLTWYGKTFDLPRLTAWYGDKGYNYSGVYNEPRAMPPTLDKVRNELSNLLYQGEPLRFNSVLCNYYRDGSDKVGWHSDDEASLGPTRDNILIGSVSVGGTRKFVLRHRENKTKKEFELTHGDLFIMGGKLQLLWEHQIPKTSKKVKPRLNLTYRHIV